MPVVNYFSVEKQLLGEQAGDAGTRVDYLTDALGSVTTTTDQAATVRNTYRYKPYGDLLTKTGASLDSSFLWVGSRGYKKTDARYNGTYIRARHYDQKSGKFTTEAPLIEQLSGEHKYAYAFNNPCTYTDASGRNACGDIPCSSMTREQMCRQAFQNGMHEGNEGMGFCCDGKKTYCVFAYGARPGIRKCIGVHEQVHLKQPSDPCPGKGLTPTTAPSLLPSGVHKECSPRFAEINCLLSSRHDECGKLTGIRKKKCIEDYNDQLGGTCSSMIIQFRCPFVPKGCRGLMKGWLIGNQEAGATYI